MTQQFASGAEPDPTPRGSAAASEDADGGIAPDGLLPTVPSPRIDIDDPAFAIRLARLLVHRRESIGVGLGAMARRSNSTLSRAELRDCEAGVMPLEPGLVSRLVALYGVDLDDITPARLPVRLDPTTRTVATGDVAAHFSATDPDEPLRTYLHLVRRLRDQQSAEVITLRRDDVEDLARFLDQPTESVLHRLCDLMGSTRSQRRVVVGMCLAGAMMVTVAVPSAAALRSDASSSSRRPDQAPIGRSIVDPMIDPFAPTAGPLQLRPDLGPLIIVDLDGAWDRDAVLDADGRLRSLARPSDDGFVDEASAAPPGLPAPGDPDPDDPDAGDPNPGDPDPDDPDAGDPVWVPPFPERVVDPGPTPPSLGPSSPPGGADDVGMLPPPFDPSIVPPRTAPDP